MEKQGIVILLSHLQHILFILLSDNNEVGLWDLNKS